MANIEGTGWLSFGEGIGDHRIAFLDIQLGALISKDKYEIVSRRARRLQIKNENTVKKYITIYEQEFVNHRIVERLVKVRKEINRGCTKGIGEKLNQIDQIRKKIVLKAKKCQKVKTGRVPYVPEEVQLYGRHIRFWTLVIAKKSGKKLAAGYYNVRQRKYQF